MTREEARKAAEVMLAYANGKQIEYKVHGADEWRPINELDTPLFDWNSTKYRIKPESTYRPFKDRDECWAEMQKHQPFGWVMEKKTNVYYSIVALNNVHPYFSNDCGDDYEHLFRYVVFADGKPFGIKEE